MRNTPRNYDSYNMYMNRQVKTPFFTGLWPKMEKFCSSRQWRNFVKEAPLGSRQVKLHNPRGSGNVCPELKEKIGNLQGGVRI